MAVAKLRINCILSTELRKSDSFNVDDVLDFNVITDYQKGDEDGIEWWLSFSKDPFCDNPLWYDESLYQVTGNVNDINKINKRDFGESLKTAEQCIPSLDMYCRINYKAVVYPKDVHTLNVGSVTFTVLKRTA